MCFNLPDGETKVPTTATTPITVWKVVDIEDDGEGTVLLRSEHRCFEYKVGRSYKVKGRWWGKTRHVPADQYQLAAGFHAFRFRKAALDHRCEGQALLKCEIPAGANYFQNREETISNRIKVVQSIVKRVARD